MDNEKALGNLVYASNVLDSLIDEARNITQPEIWKEDEEQEYLLQCEKFLLKVRNLKKSGEK